MFQMGGSRFSVDHVPNKFSGRWHQVAGRRICSSRDQGSMASTECSGPECNAAPDPDAALKVARSKVSSLLAALAAMGTHLGSEKDAHRVVEGEAGKQAAQERPLKARLAHADAFIERSRLRIQKLETRSKDGASFSVAETGRAARADRCRAKCRCTPSPIFRGRVGKVEGQSLSTSHPIRGSAEAAEAARTRAAKRKERRPRFRRVDWELRDANERGRFGVSHTFDKFHSQDPSRMKTKAWQPFVLSNTVVS